LRTDPRIGWLGRGTAQRARQPAPGHPITRAGTGQRGAAGRRDGKGEEEEWCAADVWSLASARKKKKNGGSGSWAAQLNSLMGLLGWAGSGLAGSVDWLLRFKPATKVTD
jgi:hypothetical protein